MIEDQRVEYEGRVYQWRYDPDAPAKAVCWRWTAPITFLTVPNAIESQLDRKFITVPEQNKVRLRAKLGQ